MTQSAFVRQEMGRLFEVWSLRFCLIGAALFLLLSPLDYVSVPEQFRLFLVFRVAAAAFLAACALMIRRSQNRIFIRVVTFLAVLASASAIEMMILNFGGHASPYYAGMILLGVVVLGFFPAGMSYHLLLAGTIYGVYLLPIIAMDEITDLRIFATQNYFLVGILAACLLLRHLNMRFLVRQIGLSQELEQYQVRLEDYATRRSLELSDAVQELQEENEQRKKMEAALLKASEEWRSTFDSTSDLILLANLGGDIIKANIATADFMGRPIREVVGLSVFGLFEKDALPRKGHPYTRMLDLGTRVLEELHVPSTDQWYLMSAEPLRQEHWPSKGGVVIVRNITQVKLMEQALVKARDEWEETFELIRDGISIHGHDYEILRANASARRLVGNPALEGRKCYEIFHGTDEPVQGCPACEARRTGCATVVNLYEPTIDRYLEVTALPRPGGTSAGIIHVMHDITERKETMDQLNRAAVRMESILERASFGIFIINAEGNVEYANPAMLALTGFTREEFIGINLQSLPGCAPLGMSEKVGAAMKGEHFRFGPSEYHCHRREGSSYANFTGVPLEEEGERKVLIFIEDVSELIEAEKKHRQLNALLLQAQKMESIGTLASGIAHDFNNLLLAIMGFSDAAGEKLPADHGAREDLETVILAAEKGADLVKKMLAFARQQDLELRAVDLNEVVAGMGKMLTRVLPKKIDVTIRPSGQPCIVMADSVQIEQVLFNLGINARDAMPEGGGLSIRIGTLSEEDADAEKGPIVPSGPYAVIDVSDTGVGMEREVKERIFEPFFTTKEGRGSGLGLAMSYGIVAQHGGLLEVESTPGKGTSFYICLPLVEPANRPVPEGETSPGSETVLLVEKEETS